MKNIFKVTTLIILSCVLAMGVYCLSRFLTDGSHLSIILTSLFITFTGFGFFIKSPFSYLGILLFECILIYFMIEAGPETYADNVAVDMAMILGFLTGLFFKRRKRNAMTA